MNDEHDKDLDQDLKQALGSFGTPEKAPPAMEDRIVGALQRRGLLRPRRASRWVRAVLALAASVMLFSGGVGLGLRLHRPTPAPSPPAPSSESRYVLFLYGGDADPAGQRARIEEYSAWARDLRQSGQLVTGEKLKNSEDLLAPTRPGRGGSRLPAIAPPGPGGYFIVAARDAAQARTIASTCPHLRHGGTIVIRPIDPV